MGSGHSHGNQSRSKFSSGKPAAEKLFFSSKLHVRQAGRRSRSDSWENVDPSCDGPRSVDEALALNDDGFAAAADVYFQRFDDDLDGFINRRELRLLVSTFAEALGVEAADDELDGLDRQTLPLGCSDQAKRSSEDGELLCSQQVFSIVREGFAQLSARGYGAAHLPSAALVVALARRGGRHAIYVKLEGSQYFRLPKDSPLRLRVRTAQITDRFYERNDELMCEVRIFLPRNPIVAVFVSSDSYPKSVLRTAPVRGEALGKSGVAMWLFEEELCFRGQVISDERQADRENGLQAQVVLSRLSGEALAATNVFKVLTGVDQEESLFTRSTFNRKQVGQITVIAGWVGPEMVAWLAAEVLRRSKFAMWPWVLATLHGAGEDEALRVADAIDDDGRSSLIYAAMDVGDCGIDGDAVLALAMLLALQVDPNIQDKHGFSALHYAAFVGGNEALAQLLVARGDANAVGDGNASPLMLAALGGAYGTAELLLEHGAKIETLDRSGLTAVAWLCLGCGGRCSRSGQFQLENIGPEETHEVEPVRLALLAVLERQPAVPWFGHRRKLMGKLVGRLFVAVSLSSESLLRYWVPVAREAARPGPFRHGCFAELLLQLRQLGGLQTHILGSLMSAAVSAGPGNEALCHALLRESGEVPIIARLSDGRSLVEAALDHGWSEVAMAFVERGAILRGDFAEGPRALRSALDGGHVGIARRLVAQWAESLDTWQRPAALASDGVAECPVCFAVLCKSRPVSLMDSFGRQACPHILCFSCANVLVEQDPARAPKCPACRAAFQPPARSLPDPREDPGGWFNFFDTSGTGFLERNLLEQVLPAVVPVDQGRLVEALNGALWAEWDPEGEDHISRSAFCSETGLLRWLVEHLAELKQDDAHGEPPSLLKDREGWFHHWARAGSSEMGRDEVLRAILKTVGASSLEANLVAHSREWIERCWHLWDRDGSGRISLEEFRTNGGLADMMLQQSQLAAIKRVVRRMELEPHSVPALVTCCQRLVECAIGILPEDPPASWPEKALRRLHERANSPDSAEYEEALCAGTRQLSLAMRTHASLPPNPKLFSWCCRALTAMSFRPEDFVGRPSPVEWQAHLSLSKLFAPCSESIATGTTRRRAPSDAMIEVDVPAWCFVLRGFLTLFPECPATPGLRPVSSSPLPGSLREAAVCAIGALCVFAFHGGQGAHRSITTAVATVVQAGSFEGSSCVGGSSPKRGSAAGFAPSTALVAWVAATTAALHCDLQVLAQSALGAVDTESASDCGRARSTPAFLVCLHGFCSALAEAHRKTLARPVEGTLDFESQLAMALHNEVLAAAAHSPGPECRGTRQTHDGQLKVGDAVRLMSNVEKCKELQEPKEVWGGFCASMTFCCGQVGRLVEIPNRSPSSPHPEGVRISHGALGCWFWNSQCVGEVISDAGLLGFEGPECGPGAVLTIGAEVRIIEDTSKAKLLQKNHGGWNDKMRRCCGSVGRLMALDKDGDMKVYSPGVGTFVWNPLLIRARSEQPWQLALRERLEGSLEEALPLAVLAALVALGGRMSKRELGFVLRGMRASSERAAASATTVPVTTAWPPISSSSRRNTREGALLDATQERWLFLVGSALCLNPEWAERPLRPISNGAVAPAGSLSARSLRLPQLPEVAEPARLEVCRAERCVPSAQQEKASLQHEGAEEEADASQEEEERRRQRYEEAGFLSPLAAWWHGLQAQQKGA